MKKIRNIHFYACLGMICLLCFSSCTKDDDPNPSPTPEPAQDYTVTTDDRIAVTFGVPAQAMDEYQTNTDFLRKVFTFKAEERDQLEEALKTVKFVFMYIDATKASDEERMSFVEHFKHLWKNGLKEKRDHVLFALRIGEHAPITERLIGFDIGAGLYFFSGKPNSLVYVDEVDTPVADMGLQVMADFVLRNFSGTTRSGGYETELPGECCKKVYRELNYYYERQSPFRYDAQGTFYADSLPATLDAERRSAVVSLSLEFDIYSAKGSTDRWISINARGEGYKTNLQTNTGAFKNGNLGQDMVLYKKVHTGNAYIGNLIRQFTIRNTMSAADIQAVEYLPDNVVKEDQITQSKKHEIGLMAGGSGGPQGGEGTGEFSYKYEWATSVSYNQADFEMYNTPTSLHGSSIIEWKTIPARFFHKPAWRGDFGTSELDIRELSRRTIAAGKAPQVFLDFNSPDFPKGFHNMKPQASALYYTNSDEVKAKVEAILELQDSRQYWCAGTRHNSHEYNVRTLTGSYEMKIKFSAEEVVFE